jgi:hypothetical protein
MSGDRSVSVNVARTTFRKIVVSRVIHVYFQHRGKNEPLNKILLILHSDITIELAAHFLRTTFGNL